MTREHFGSNYEEAPLIYVDAVDMDDLLSSVEPHTSAPVRPYMKYIKKIPPGTTVIFKTNDLRRTALAEVVKIEDPKHPEVDKKGAGKQLVVTVTNVRLIRRSTSSEEE